MELQPEKPEKGQDQDARDPFEDCVGELPAFPNADAIKTWIRDIRGEDFEEDSNVDDNLRPR